MRYLTAEVKTSSIAGAAHPLETRITMHEDLRNSPRCRVTFDALVKGLQQHVA